MAAYKGRKKLRTVREMWDYIHQPHEPLVGAIENAARQALNNRRVAKHPNYDAFIHDVSTQIGSSERTLNALMGEALSTLGGHKWLERHERIKSAIRKLARELGETTDSELTMLQRSPGREIIGDIDSESLLKWRQITLELASIPDWRPSRKDYAPAVNSIGHVVRIAAESWRNQFGMKFSGADGAPFTELVQSICQVLESTPTPAPGTIRKALKKVDISG